MKKEIKRRKDKYNPYTLINLEKKKKYLITFKDELNNENFIEVTKKVYNAFNEFELVDLSQMNKFDRHIEHSELNEITLNKRIFNKEKSIEEIVINNIEMHDLYVAISQLPDKQKDRIYKYFFDNLTLREIAQLEKCSIRAIQYSMEGALKNLRNFLDWTS